jgi:hypothetical protein
MKYEICHSLYSHSLQTWALLVHWSWYNKVLLTGWPINNRNLFLIVLEAGKSKIKVPRGLGSGEDLPSSAYMTIFLCSHMAVVTKGLPQVSFIKVH